MSAPVVARAKKPRARNGVFCGDRARQKEAPGNPAVGQMLKQAIEQVLFAVILVLTIQRAQPMGSPASQA
jgi:hypothetical protein